MIIGDDDGDDGDDVGGGDDDGEDGDNEKGNFLQGLGRGNIKHQGKLPQYDDTMMEMMMIIKLLARLGKRRAARKVATRQ